MDNLTSNNNPNFYWWFGAVEDRNDPLRLGRCRVRILGYHTADIELLPTEHLPWAMPVMPANSAGTSGVGWSPTGAVEGSWVVGFFADGENGQHPMFFGTVGAIPGGLRANDCSPTDGSGGANDSAVGEGTGGRSVDLENISGDAKDNESYLEQFLEANSKYIPNWSKMAKAAIMAQCAHESGNFRKLTENLNYSAERLSAVFPRIFPTPASASSYGGNPQKIANRVYANKIGNGSESSGDGWKYRGRGFIQLTGKSNYRACKVFTKLDVLSNPDLVATREGAAAAVLYYFGSPESSLGYGMAKRGQWADINAVTRSVNTASEGLADRINKFAYYKKKYGIA